MLPAHPRLSFPLRRTWLTRSSIESWPFKVIDQEGSPMVEVEYLGENKIFSPQEISSMVLTKVRLFLENIISPLIPQFLTDEGSRRS